MFSPRQSTCDAGRPHAREWLSCSHFADSVDGAIAVHHRHVYIHQDYVAAKWLTLPEVDAGRLQLWTFARAAADPRQAWNNPVWIDIARALAP
jgi:hypothetical protein